MFPSNETAVALRLSGSLECPCSHNAFCVVRHCCRLKAVLFACISAQNAQNCYLDETGGNRSRIKGMADVESRVMGCSTPQEFCQTSKM